MKEPIYYTMGNNNPAMWETEDYGVINFATPEDARKAAALLIKIQEYYAAQFAASRSTQEEK